MLDNHCLVSKFQMYDLKKTFKIIKPSYLKSFSCLPRSPRLLYLKTLFSKPNANMIVQLESCTYFWGEFITVSWVHIITVERLSKVQTRP